MDDRASVVAVPESVRTELRRGVRSVLVDATALRLVRDRFDDDQAGSLRRYLEASQSANTLRAYRTDWVAWAAWCTTEGRQALPADALDVAVYLAAAADARRATRGWAFSPATLERKSAAIAAVHAANGLPSPTRSDVVRLTLRGVRRTRRTQPARKRPVLLHTLDQLLAGLPEPGWPTEPARRRDALALLVGFAGALRRSELAGLRIGDVSVTLDHGTGEPILLIRLPATKTDPTGAAEQRVALPRGRRPATCPVCTLAEWLRLREVHCAAGTLGVRTWLADLPATDPVIHRCHGYTGTVANGDLPSSPPSPGTAPSPTARCPAAPSPNWSSGMPPEPDSTPTSSPAIHCARASRRRPHSAVPATGRSCARAAGPIPAPSTATFAPRTP